MIKGSKKGSVHGGGRFFSRLRKKRSPEILAGFIGGGWLILEFVHWILIDHYHFPENLLDITFITLLCALGCVLVWRLFAGSGSRRRRFAFELLLIPFFILAAGYWNVHLIGTWGTGEAVGAPEAEKNADATPGPSPMRAAVGIFANLTGDPSLDILGKIAADWITQGISKIPGLEVSPPAAVEGSSVKDLVQDLARLTGAGTIITGGFLLENGSLEFKFQITDARRSKRGFLRGVAPRLVSIAAQ